MESDVLHELLNLQKASYESDKRLESKVDTLGTRMEYIENHAVKQDKQIEKMTEILSNQKNLSNSVEELTQTVKNHSDRLIKLENKDGATALAIWKKIGGIVLTGVVTTIVGLIIGKLL